MTTLAIFCTLVVVGFLGYLLYHLPFIGSKWEKDGQVWTVEGDGYMDDVHYCRIVYDNEAQHEENLVTGWDLFVEYKRVWR